MCAMSQGNAATHGYRVKVCPWPFGVCTHILHIHYRTLGIIPALSGRHQNETTPTCKYLLYHTESNLQHNVKYKKHATRIIQRNQLNPLSNKTLQNIILIYPLVAWMQTSHTLYKLLQSWGKLNIIPLAEWKWEENIFSQYQSSQSQNTGRHY